VPRLRPLLTLGLAISVTSTIAWGGPQDTRAGGASEMSTLLGDVDRYAAEAQGQDCAAACRAIDSMRSATERICEIDPGDPCARARETLRKSGARVRAACPDCAVASDKKLAPQEADAPPQAPRPTTPQGTAEAEAVHSKGGCASCTTVGERSGDEEAPPWALLVLGSVAMWATRRRRT
jgi:hypothetical protein